MAKSPVRLSAVPYLSKVSNLGASGLYDFLVAQEF